MTSARRILALLMLITSLQVAVGASVEATGICPAVTGTNPTKAEVRDELSRAAGRYDLPAPVLYAIAWIESGWRQFGASGALVCNPDPGVADNQAGGIGMMQLTNGTAQGFDIVRLADDWRYNIDAGARVLLTKWDFIAPSNAGDLQRDILENWIWAAYLYNGGPSYGLTMASLVRSPPVALSGLVDPVEITLPSEAIPNYSFPRPAFQARADNKWILHSGAPNYTILGTFDAPTHNWRAALGPERVRVAGAANLRVGQSTETTLVAQLPAGTEVTLQCWIRGLAVAGTGGVYTLWHRVEAAGQTGYLWHGSLALPPFPEVGADRPVGREPGCVEALTVVGPANLRARSTTASAVLARVPNGTRFGLECWERGLTVNGTSLWHRVSYGGDIGFLWNGLFDSASDQPLAGEPPCAAFPSAPTRTGPVSVANTSDGVQVSWTAPSGDGGSPLTGYLVRATPGNLERYVVAPATSTVVADLPKGPAHLFSVAAFNGVAIGPAVSSTGIVVSEPEPFAPVTPTRVLDTRPGSQRVGYAGVRPAAGQTVEITIPGAPASATAAALQVTAVSPATAGHLTVWACGAAKPNTSAVNVSSQITGGNLTISRLGSGGKVCLYTAVAADLVVDLQGWFSPGPAHDFPTPTRVLDTRPGLEVGSVGGRRVAGQVTQLQLGAVPAGTNAVALTVAAIEPDAAAYITVWPCGTDRPTASNLNPITGRVTSNLVLSGLGLNATVCLFTSTGTHLIADLVATMGGNAANGGFGAQVPQRLLETRATQSLRNWSGGRPGAGATISVPVPGGAGPVALNVTAVDAPSGGYVTVWPCGETRPLASSLNPGPDTFATATLVLTRAGANGAVCIHTAGPTHLIADFAGRWST